MKLTPVQAQILIAISRWQDRSYVGLQASQYALVGHPFQGGKAGLSQHLRRLEKRELVRGRLLDVPGGAAPKCYRLTARGSEALLRHSWGQERQRQAAIRA